MVIDGNGSESPPLDSERKAMSLRFRRSVSIVPGVRLNLGMHGAGVSLDKLLSRVSGGSRVWRL
jgi:hypothetical protein